MINASDNRHPISVEFKPLSPRRPKEIPVGERGWGEGSVNVLPPPNPHPASGHLLPRGERKELKLCGREFERVATTRSAL
jgi:hypothetical protein